MLTRDSLDSMASELTQVIALAAKASIPTSRPRARPKPWWSPELQGLRTTMLRQQRGMVGDHDSKQLYCQARNAYFQAIKQAKRDH
jgi:hypothetical protein